MARRECVALSAPLSRLLAVCTTLAFAVALFDAAPVAAAPEQLWDACRSADPKAPAGQQCANPRGVAADSRNGHLFVADQANRRVIELNARGDFIKAWGWDVVVSGPGDDTTPPEDEFEICIPGEGDVCKGGSQGGGAGQFGATHGVAVDSVGDVYVTDRAANRRMQKFDRKGNVIFAIGRNVNKTKVEEAAPQAQRNICTAASGDVCQGGVEGSGAGEFTWPLNGDYIAIDTAGTDTAVDDDVYVGDVNRIQRFDATGAYQDECSVGGTVESLTVDSAGNLYAIWGGAIHRLSYASPACPETTPAGGFKVSNPSAVAVSFEGQVFAFRGGTDPICELSPGGALVECFGGGGFSSSTGLEANLCAGSEAPGSLYVTNFSLSDAFLRAYGTDPIGCFKARTLPPAPVEETSATLNGTVDPDGEVVSECFFEYGTSTEYGQVAQCVPGAGELTGSEPVPVQADLTGLPAATVHHVRLVAVIGGETEAGADEQFKTKGPPVISDDHTVTVGNTEATLRALVNPEGLPTSYRFEYITEADFEAAGNSFTGAQSTPLIALGEDREAHPVSAELSSLVPGTSYRWRIVATNTAVLDGGVSVSEAHAIQTRRPPVADTACPNQAFRSGASALLPDCRAYEIVSPLDKNGGDITRFQIGLGDTDAYVQATPGGDAITFTSLAGFGELEAGANFNQYLASREAGGWSSRGIRPPTTGHHIDITSDTLNGFRQFMLFTPDLCSAWLIDYQTPPMTEDGQDGFPNLYRRNNCEPEAGGLEAVTDVPLPEETPIEYIDRKESVHGASADGRHVFFVAAARLVGGLVENGRRLYDHFCPAASVEACSRDEVESTVALVGILPDKDPEEPFPKRGDGEGFPALTAQLGTADGWAGNLDGAVAEDGSRAYWTSSGRLYLRIHPEQGLVLDECTDNATVACTVRVSVGSAANFWGASPDGSKAIYTDGGTLYEFDLGRQEAEPASASQPIADGVIGVAGASEDLSRVYFASRKALAVAGPNSEGDEAIAGAPNLYLYEGAGEGSYAFIGTLSEKDVGEVEPGGTSIAYNVVGLKPLFRATRVSADGSRIAFLSRASLTGYDSTETASGKAAAEVFAYEAGGEIVCASCNPSGSRPRGTEEMRESLFFPPGIDVGGAPTLVPAAAWIPGWEHAPHASNVLSADGERLFFNSHDALLPGDTNGAMDVYEWEAAGTGSCDVGDPDHFPQNGGCLYLISSGESPWPSEFWEASADGSDVFFTTEASLVPPDPGSIDLYDARVGGGFTYPVPKAECEGEACQSPPAPPQLPTPSSASYDGPADPPPAKQKRACPQGKRKVRRAGRVRCVRKKQGQARHNRRPRR